MAVYYDDSTFWDYTLQDIAAIFLSFLPHTFLLLLISHFIFKYKETVFKVLARAFGGIYSGNGNSYPSKSNRARSNQELIESLLETVKNEDIKLLEIQDMIGKTNEKLHRFSEQLNSFQEMKDACSKKYGEMVAVLNDFSKNVTGQLEKMSLNKDQVGEYISNRDSILKDVETEQSPVTNETVQDQLTADSEITDPKETKLIKNLNFSSKIPVLKKM